MNTKFATALLSLVILFATVPRAAGQDPAAAEADEPAPEFEVEVIVFEYVSGAVGAREDWQYIDTGRDRVQAQIGAMQSQSALSFTDSDDNESSMEDEETEPEGEPKPLIWRPIASEQRNLTETFARMRNSRDYRPLLYAAWTQTVYGETDKTTLALDRVTNVPGGLNASASLYVERFLHLTLDLELAKPAGMKDPNDSGSRTVTYRLAEKRKMRSGETHFFDHPRFGAVALISKPSGEMINSSP
ncbi:MAG: CsiV family protein [Pseudomonadota bacterium]